MPSYLGHRAPDVHSVRGLSFQLGRRSTSCHSNPLGVTVLCRTSPLLRCLVPAEHLQQGKQQSSPYVHYGASQTAKPTSAKARAPLSGGPNVFQGICERATTFCAHILCTHSVFEHANVLVVMDVGLVTTMDNNLSQLILQRTSPGQQASRDSLSWTSARALQLDPVARSSRWHLVGWSKGSTRSVHS